MPNGRWPPRGKRPALKGHSGAADKPANSAQADGLRDAAAVGAAPSEEVAPRTRHALGSLDPEDPAQVLFTLTSRGAAVERIELAGEPLSRSG